MIWFIITHGQTKSKPVKNQGPGVGKRKPTFACPKFFFQALLTSWKIRNVKGHTNRLINITHISEQKHDR